MELNVSDCWNFNGQMTSRTGPQTKNIRRGEEKVNASDFGQSENKASVSTV